MTVATADFIVADLALAPWGRRELSIAETERRQLVPELEHQRQESRIQAAKDAELQRLRDLVADGPPFDPFRQAAPDTTLSVADRPIGGLGIHLVRELMDEVSYERRDARNVVILVKQLVVG